MCAVVDAPSLLYTLHWDVDSLIEECNDLAHGFGAGWLHVCGQ